MSKDKPTYTDQQLLQTLQGNFAGNNLVLLKYFKERDSSWEDLAVYIGHEFAEQFPPGLTAKQFAEPFALSWAAAGAEILMLSGDDERAEFVMANAPPEDALKAFGLTREDFDAYSTVPRTCAADLGFDLDWSRDGDKITISISRQDQT
jgi:hypothetical protein